MTNLDFFKDYPAPAGGTEPIIPAAAPGPAPSTGDDAIPLDAFVGAANGTPEEEVQEPESEPAAECAAVVEWRREFAKGLETKMANERKVKAERAEQARKTLTTLHGNWTKKTVETKEANKKSEKEFLRDRDALLARMSKPGDPPAWGVIPELVDMTGKFKEGARDTSRMRQVLMKMKTY